jgi:hypothetical protein
VNTAQLHFYADDTVKADGKSVKVLNVAEIVAGRLK